MSNKILSVIGPTAVGKTGFSLQLINLLKNETIGGQFTGYDLISADSRQVYKDLEVISGADIPQDFTKQENYFVKENVKLHGLLMLDYQEEWSLAHFKKFAEEIIQKSWGEKRLPIMVGGTGLYHQHLFNDSDQIWIGPNQYLRNELSLLSLQELQERLKRISQEKFQSMNNSDKNNPVRLIRAIEICESTPLDNKDNQNKSSKTDYMQLVIGLNDQLELIEQKIKERVLERFNNGAIEEVEKIKQKSQDFPVNKQLTSATGVKEVQAFIDGQIEKEQCLQKWSLREYQYAKRQLTWWKKRQGINWYQIDKESWQEEAFSQVNDFLLSEKT